MLVWCEAVSRGWRKASSAGMLVFPPVALKPEVRDHLKNTFKNEEVGDASMSVGLESVLCL